MELQKSYCFAMSEVVDRIAEMNNSAIEVVPELKYSSELSAEETKELQGTINKSLDAIQELSQQKAALETQIKQARKSAFACNDQIIAGVKQRKEKVWILYNPETGYNEYINVEGYIVKEAKARNGQKAIFDSRTGTNDK